MKNPFLLLIYTSINIKISNRFADLENLHDSEDINRAWGNIKDERKISAKDSLGLYELKQDKPWFREESLDLLDQRTWAKMQCYRIQIIASRHFRNKKDEYLIANIDELETNCMIRGIRYFYRSINDFKMGY
jgi:hypothetical protein